MTLRRHGKYFILLMGYVLTISTYFCVKIWKYLPLETAHGEVTRIMHESFTTDMPSQGLVGSHVSVRPYHGDFLCPEVQFVYRHREADTLTWYRVHPQAYSFHEYQPGDKIGLIFPKGQPERSSLYSFGEYWLPAPWLIIIGGICALWSIGFFVVVFKPWRD